MNESARVIRTLADLKAREIELKREMVEAKKSALASVKPSGKKVAGYALGKVAPFAAAGVGIWLAFQFFGNKSEESGPLTTVESKTNKYDNPPAVRRAALREGDDQEAAAASVTNWGRKEWIALIRQWWPVLKIVFTTAQAFYVKKQAEKVQEESAST